METQGNRAAPSQGTKPPGPGAATARTHATRKGRPSRGRIVVSWRTTTDHKHIGALYLVTAFAFFLIGGAMALVMRAELARPGTQTGVR